MERYKVVEGSQSAHCCFGYTVVDTTKPTMIGGELWAPKGFQQYDEVCETFEESEAVAIAEAMNWRSYKETIGSNYGTFGKLSEGGQYPFIIEYAVLHKGENVVVTRKPISEMPEWLQKIYGRDS